MARPMKSLTVKELIEQLQDMPEDAVVVLTSDYGDHCHTEQALRIDAVEETTIRHRGAYSTSGWVVDEDAEDDVDEPVMPVVALRTPIPSNW